MFDATCGSGAVRAVLVPLGEHQRVEGRRFGVLLMRVEGEQVRGFRRTPEQAGASGAIAPSDSVTGLVPSVAAGASGACLGAGLETATAVWFCRTCDPRRSRQYPSATPQNQLVGHCDESPALASKAHPSDLEKSTHAQNHYGGKILFVEGVSDAGHEALATKGAVVAPFHGRVEPSQRRRAVALCAASNTRTRASPDGDCHSAALRLEHP